MLTESPTPLTHRELLARGCELGLFVRSGTGTKTDAFRYGVVSQTKPTDPAA